MFKIIITGTTVIATEDFENWDVWDKSTDERSCRTTEAVDTIIQNYSFEIWDKIMNCSMPMIKAVCDNGYDIELKPVFKEFKHVFDIHVYPRAVSTAGNVS